MRYKDKIMDTYETIKDIIRLHHAPEIPGLTFRGFHGEEDYPKMADVIENSKDADQVERATTVEDIAISYACLLYTSDAADE